MEDDVEGVLCLRCVGHSDVVIRAIRSCAYSLGKGMLCLPS